MRLKISQQILIRNFFLLLFSNDSFKLIQPIGKQYDDPSLPESKYNLGFEIFPANQIGVFYYHSPSIQSTCSIVCNGGTRVSQYSIFISPKNFKRVQPIMITFTPNHAPSSNQNPQNHTVTVSNKGFQPMKLKVDTGDRVWWVWQEANERHNIIQVGKKS